ncbi:HAD superfamily hydrolase (TIGR01509 family) [Antricoccus suffuscus]|uniref:HAD superfamily hydrolase (TIGR01509 family) n=1 Tax=Antricoccus suffuscus TaxID=1629062 RepID=A0A2T1A259_9ACTN|nr:HAD family hydrolase [Antricoccus suffuscus]PRZ42673.1 HAD superfamily hydrolase (TIGR01509 family) [Antricoccus suffuscus]
MAVGIIFDCDGVLVDSEPLANRVFAQMLTDIGLPTSADSAMRDFMGRSTSAVAAIVEQRLGHALPPTFLDEYASRCEECFAHELRAVAGVEAALGRITPPTCVASSGSHEKIRFTLGHTGLLAHFEGRIFSATEVAHGKPSPDLFLHAAARMGFEPKHAIVVEDSPSGVRAGVAAGMAVLAYAGHVPCEELAAAGGRVFTDMADLPMLINGLLAEQLRPGIDTVREQRDK